MPLSVPELAKRKAFLERCVLSASGLRFIHSGDEDDASAEVCDEAKLFVLCALESFLIKGNLQGKVEIWLGRDSRPSGPFLLNLAEHFLRSKGVRVRKMGLGPIPEVMAATHQGGAQAFVYFTASHNPKGHNGLKLGLADGAVLPKALAGPMIDLCKEIFLNDERSDAIWKLWNDGDREVSEKEQKDESLSFYTKFSLSTVCPEDPEHFLKRLSSGWGGGETPLFLIDMNGSSRLTSVDVDFLRMAGLEVELMGDQPGIFNHAIIPEGASLEPLRKKMQEHLDSGRRVLGGMVPDCDGDRGNLILPIGGQATPLKAQETFSLCVLAELATRRVQGDQSKMALVVNGPTSLRIDHMLNPFQIEVRRAEVGEANVLGLARNLRAQGLSVPLSGEGSNGGNILHPSTVRDPLMTILSLLKYVALPVNGNQTGVELQLKRANLDPCMALEKIFESMPNWISTDAFEGEALMPVPPVDHETLKCGYEEVLLSHFNSELDFWGKKGIKDLRFVSNDGTENISGPGGRPKDSKGGLQVFLEDESGNDIGFLWMRGSGTEPVFRVMVDWSGPQEAYEELLALHRSLIERAISG